ncbi:MAG: acyl--CoA ligase [Chloroflexi bacterium]|nr:MAG: acyl--CoA ligase [Chloroflexota bacterium]
MHILGTRRPITQRLRLAMDRDLGAGSFFWRACAVASDPERPLLYHPDVRRPDWDAAEPPGHSLDSMRATVVRYAHWYRSQGVTAYSRVGVYTRDGMRTLLNHIAITSLGAIAVHANPRMAPAVAADYFRRTEVAALIGDPDLITDCLAASGAAEFRPPAVVVDVDAMDAEAVAPPRPLDDFPYRHDDADLVMISHSSGTTGRPKAPVFGHRSFFVGKRERLFTFPQSSTERMVSALPHSHSAGISYLMMAVLVGVPTLVLDGADGPRLARAMNQFLPTVVIGFPLTLAELPIGDLSPEAARSVRMWMGMGDASHERHIRPLLGVGAAYLDGLGSSEMGMVLFSRVHTSATSSFGRDIGRPARVVRDAAALDEQGNKLGPGQAGALGVRTPSSTPGYWDDPDLNVRSLRRGYWLTGDVVRQGADGRWFHLDRVPDVIHSAAGPVYSLPLEEVVLLVTGAPDAAVIAVDDPDAGGASCPAAVLLFDEPPRRGPAELLADCNAALRGRGLAELRGLVVAGSRDELPVGVTGKVLKRELRERHRALLGEGPGRGVAIAGRDGAGRLATAAAEVSG